MKLITGREALDETNSEDSYYLVSWFQRVLVDTQNIQMAIEQNLDLEEGENHESIFKVAELADHCTAREPVKRPEMGHVVTVLSSLVEQWRPFIAEDDKSYDGIELRMNLSEMLQRWQGDEGTSRMCGDDSDLIISVNTS
ncbi:hypothetical protein DM860_005661 [Cuscuta australis]|uniref:Serine-threonine/tyrosine-protein kinase catalytic domain-containing protein n=1 Tax=Cuscuta australis TaxID=267555 RepID=A0A328DRB5_9ASTE|nr:hypothetical protein DM860_005661 [Cuscuta australis]